MSITTFSFILFCFLLCVLYFIFPKKHQWTILLAASVLFYLSFGLDKIIYVLFTATISFFAVMYMQRNHKYRKEYIKKNRGQLSKEEKNAFKLKCKRKVTATLVVSLVSVIGLLCFFKYCNFLINNINGVLHWFDLSNAPIPNLSIVAPLGISFYTFQTIGCLVDVYWEKYDVTTNYFKFILFVMFFPQITQGPIGRYDLLAPQLYEGHSFDYKNFKFGCMRMLWGFYKKMVIADRLAPYLTDAFVNYHSYSGPTVLICAFMYSLQIYADFSGYMDIVCGLSQILGIELSENFIRPYFSKSIAEYWRRWHITLGTWFKDYLYYPIAVSRFSVSLSKLGKKTLGAQMGKLLSATFALIVVWFATGFWHGATWPYIIWGGINGAFIIFSMFMEPVYQKMKSICHINEKATCWRIFAILRTFFLVTLIKVFPEVGSFSDGVGFIGSCFMNWGDVDSLFSILPAQQQNYDYLIFISGAMIIFVVSLLQRSEPVRKKISNSHFLIRWPIYLILFFVVIVFGVGSSTSTGGFMYAIF